MSTLSNPYVARHGMTSSGYQTEFNKWTSNGYRLYQVSGYSVNGVPRFAAIWIKASGPAYVAHHNLSSSQYQAKFNEYTAKGYRLTQVQGYESGSNTLYAAIWEKKPGPAWVTHHGMSSSQYQQKFDEYVSKGYVLTRVEGYNTGNQARFAAIWEKSSSSGWVARHGMTSSGYQTEFNKWTGKGFRLKHVSGYQVNGKDYYAAIWQKIPGGAWVARHRMTGQQYQSEFMQYHLLGYKLQLVDGYPYGKSVRYAAIWEAPKNAPAGTYIQNKYKFSLKKFEENIKEGLKGKEWVKYGFEIRHGLQVLQGANGPARTKSDAPALDFTVNQRFNPASVAKTPTSVATLQLLEKKKISVHSKMYHNLPSTWKIPDSIKTITYAELMNHSSGLRPMEGQSYSYDGMKKLVEAGIKTADKVPSYQNVNYALLRIVVASLDGYKNWTSNPGEGSANRFINYVNKKIFNPLGIYNIKYKASGSSPVLFYKYPPGNNNGTAYGDWSLKPGSAGTHISVSELTKFVSAIFQKVLFSNSTLETMKSDGLGFADYGSADDGSKLYGKGGYFPPIDGNKNAELNSTLMHSDSGVSAMLLVNGAVNTKSLLINAYKNAFTKIDINQGMSRKVVAGKIGRKSG